MPELPIIEIVKAVGGTLVTGVAESGEAEMGCRFSRFHFDSRRITEPNTLFFALKSDTGDGHRFVRQLQNRPSVGAVVAEDFDTAGITIPLIRVKDTLKAAQDLATHVRNTHRKTKYIGVTGSAGKTTTKEFIYQLLAFRYKAYRSFKNWNNWIGVPFCILNMTGEEEAAVFELAMSYPGIGEIDLLARILRPDVAVILNVYPVHMEFLKTVDNAARAKAEILNHLSADDVAVINGDNEAIMKLLSSPSAPAGRKIFFGKTASHNDIRLKEMVRLDKEKKAGSKNGGIKMVVDYYGKEVEFETPFVNRIHVENLLTAIIVAHQLGMKHYEIQEAVQNVKPLDNRGDIRRLGQVTIIDETYNSNPEALKKTLEWVDLEYGEAVGGEKIAVVGDMLELGDRENDFHFEVGQYLATLRFDRLVTVGKRAEHIAAGAVDRGFDSNRIHSFDGSTEAGKFLRNKSPEGSVLLFKASRGIQLENAINEYMKEYINE
jgi:UDP-N-acetylmuramoyl-tripeptide--D-alanyl-D-alanine ligase